MNICGDNISHVTFLCKSYLQLKKSCLLSAEPSAKTLLIAYSLQMGLQIAFKWLCSFADCSSLHLHLDLCCKRDWKFPAIRLSGYDDALQFASITFSLAMYIYHFRFCRNFISEIHHLQSKCRWTLQRNVSWVVYVPKTTYIMGYSNFFVVKADRWKWQR